MAKAKAKAWQEFGDKMKRGCKENQKAFFKALKALRIDKVNEIKETGVHIKREHP